MELKLYADSERNVGEAPEGENLASLYRWLTDDPELQGSTRIDFAAAGGGELGRMGASLDVINVLLSNSIALAGLIVSYRAWRDSRSKPERIRVEVGGVALRLDTASDKELEDLARRVDSAPSGNAPA